MDKIDFTEIRPLTGEEIILAVRMHAKRFNLTKNYMYEDIVAHACMLMMNFNDRDVTVGIKFNRAKFYVIDAIRSCTGSRCKLKYKASFATVHENIPDSRQHYDFDRMAYAVVRLQNIRLFPQYAEFALQIINGDSVVEASRKVWGESDVKTAWKHFDRLRAHIRNGGVKPGSFNSIDESKLSHSVIKALQRIRMEKVSER